MAQNDVVECVDWNTSARPSRRRPLDVVQEGIAMPNLVPWPHYILDKVIMYDMRVVANHIGIVTKDRICD
jgi:hypothetical protein